MIQMNNILTQVRQSLADGANAISRDRFFKEGEAAKVYGIQSKEVHKIAEAALRQIKDYPKKTIFALCEELWQSGYMEEIRIACVWTEALQKQYEPTDIFVFERWISDYVNNWADCDTLCNHTVGEFVMMYPEYVARLKEWAKSSNRWLRRAAAVSLIIPARKGMFLDEILEIADILLLDRDDLVQKGFGWMLKAASMSETFVKGNVKTKKKHLDAVFQFVVKNKSVMPRTALRYAIEKMPPELKAKAMEK
jgi:3-methyladenine DNA glycosylase AlkD